MTGEGKDYPISSLQMFSVLVERSRVCRSTPTGTRRRPRGNGGYRGHTERLTRYMFSSLGPNVSWAVTICHMGTPCKLSRREDRDFPAKRRFDADRPCITRYYSSEQTLGGTWVDVSSKPIMAGHPRTCVSTTPLFRLRSANLRFGVLPPLRREVFGVVHWELARSSTGAGPVENKRASASIPLARPAQAPLRFKNPVLGRSLTHPFGVDVTTAHASTVNQSLVQVKLFWPSRGMSSWF